MVTFANVVTVGVTVVVEVAFGVAFVFGVTVVVSRRDECADTLNLALDLITGAEKTWTESDKAAKTNEYLKASAYAREWLDALIQANNER